ncbi:MAG: methylglyoxal synthase [Lachnospiraceae bacterium]|nr:methylglyoxal synthase [Lachnospiraceae bacterium]
MNIGLIAHDNRKALMQNLCVAYHHILKRHTLLATGTTGRRIEEVTNLPIQKLLTGSFGEQQLCSQIDNNNIDMVIYLRDPDSRSMSNEPNLQNILRHCDANNIPVATNPATAEMLILGLDRGDLDWRKLYQDK